MPHRFSLHPRPPRLHAPAICALALCGIVSAQTPASRSGRGEDASGSVVPGVTITVHSLDTGARRSVSTDSTGHYRITALALGPQQVVASKSGFETAVRQGVVLEVGQEAVIDFRLDLGAVDQQVTVSAPAPLVNTTTSPVSGMVGETAVKDLPLNGRSFDNLITLNPGAINYTLKSANTSTSYGNTFSVAGLRPAENLFLWNGIEYTGSSQLAITPGGVSGELLGIDAVREFNVLTDTYGAAYGKRAGAHVLVVTQSGANAVHGTLFEFLRNSALDTRNFFDRSSVPPFRRNQFGGALGGPLIRNRWFLFGNYEGFRQALATSNVAVVPDQLARQGFLPVNGVYQQVPNLNPKMLNFMNYWPEPNGRELLANGKPSGTALSYSNPHQSIREDFGTLRTDANLTSRDWLAGSYTIDDGVSLLPLADPLFASLTGLRMQVASVEETHVFSPSALNRFEFGFSRAAYNLDS